MCVKSYREKLYRMNKEAEIYLLTPDVWEGREWVVKSPMDDILKKHERHEIGLNGHIKLHYYKSMMGIKRVQPDIIHLEQEPDSVSLYQVLRLRDRHSPHSKVIAFTWQNLNVKNPSL
jgi:hypothetical protein